MDLNLVYLKCRKHDCSMEFKYECSDWSVKCMIVYVRYHSKLESISVVRPVRVKCTAAYAASVGSEATISDNFLKPAVAAVWYPPLQFLPRLKLFLHDCTLFWQALQVSSVIILFK